MLTAGYEFYRGSITATGSPRRVARTQRDAAACLEELTLGRTAADRTGTAGAVPDGAMRRS
ncbi:MAG: hypothetical protein ACLUES_15480 [Flavonifractor plautii]